MNHNNGKKVTTDLDFIRVVSQGARDEVYLRHNNLKAFTVECRPPKPTKILPNKEFVIYDEVEWEKTVLSYMRWKRTKLPDFKMPNHSGRTKDGHQHPWRRHVGPRRQPGGEEDDPD
ncbi:MAG: hypothetical protein JWR69_4426 [Pedosphaera sp.]|nr:hypothetical protein [Pedosphaera sp.]